MQNVNVFSFPTRMLLDLIIMLIFLKNATTFRKLWHGIARFLHTVMQEQCIIAHWTLGSHYSLILVVSWFVIFFLLSSTLNPELFVSRVCSTITQLLCLSVTTRCTMLYNL